MDLRGLVVKALSWALLLVMALSFALLAGFLSYLVSMLLSQGGMLG